jgi:hypothetical protein
VPLIITEPGVPAGTHGRGDRPEYRCARHSRSSASPRRPPMSTAEASHLCCAARRSKSGAPLPRWSIAALYATSRTPTCQTCVMSQESTRRSAAAAIRGLKGGGRVSARCSPRTRMKIVDDVLLPSSIPRIGHLNGGAVSEAWADARSVRD